jgi:uncharacterized membrane protein HdeD (DUF308 family)
MTEATSAGTMAGESDDVRDVVAAVGRHWGWLMAFGILSILLGIALLVWPKQTLVVVATFVGAYLLVSGIFQIVAAFAAGDAPGGFRWLVGISGFFGVLLGLFAFRSIAHSLAVLVLLIGFGWIMRGMAELVEAIADKDLPARGWSIFGGILGIVAGLVVLLYPAPSLHALAVIAGIWFVVLGLIEVVGSVKLRSLPG